VTEAWIPQYEEVEVHALFLAVVESEAALIGSSSTGSLRKPLRQKQLKRRETRG